MNARFSIKPVLLAAALAAGAASVYAAESAPSQGDGTQSHPHSMMDKGMMGGGMMDMMHSCQSMMGSGMGMSGMTKLPPGNEKLEAQMHAEMMQKMGEIARRYAEQIKEAK